MALGRRIILQMPGWWMGTPWTVKRYLDEVLTKAMAACTPATAARAMTPASSTAAGACCRASITCCR